MSVDLSSRYQADEAGAPEEQAYRALSSTAVVSLALGALGMLTFLSPMLGLIPLVGLILGVYAVRSISSRPNELTGAGLARAGTLLSLVALVGGWGYHGYVYATEVPEGYERISYAELQPEQGAPPGVIPHSARALDGQKVFIKGYVYPGLQTRGIREFVLVRDKGDCCFGGNPKITDRIQVRLADPFRIDFHDGLFRVAGTFRVGAAVASDGPGGVLYHLEAAQTR
jgi:hypothetical protein